MLEIVSAASPAQIEIARTLFREYETWLGLDLCFQNFEQELAALPGKYAAPSGRLLLAMENETAAGCVALRELEPGVCEMKRLFVRENWRGRGAGKMLVEKIIEAAREIGYERMQLDTIAAKMPDAVRIYGKFGFDEIAPYYRNPVAGAIFMELKL